MHGGLIQFSLKVMRRKILKDASEKWLRTGINKDRNWEKLGKKGKRYKSGKNNTPLLTLFQLGVSEDVANTNCPFYLCQVSPRKDILLLLPIPQETFHTLQPNNN